MYLSFASFKVSWNRSARTDKGVHAAGQVISLRMNMAEEEAPAFITALNAHLPDQFEVFDCIKVTRSFNAKNQCDGRIYEYLLPTFVLAPQTATWAATKSAWDAHAAKRAAQQATLLQGSAGAAADGATAEAAAAAAAANKGKASAADLRIEISLDSNSLKLCTMSRMFLAPSCTLPKYIVSAGTAAAARSATSPTFFSHNGGQS